MRRTPAFVSMTAVEARSGSLFDPTCAHFSDRQQSSRLTGFTSGNRGCKSTRRSTLGNPDPVFGWTRKGQDGVSE